MYTITRKLAMVCLAVVFSVLVYGCGGGSSEQATITPEDMDGMDMVMTRDVDTSMVSDGLEIMAGIFPILPGETADAGDATITCADDGLACDVNVDDEGNATSTGGMATAVNSAQGYKKLYMSQIVDTGELAEDYNTMTPDIYIIESGRSMDVDDVNFTCPADGVRCEVTVADDGTVTSVGGAATAQNSNAVEATMTAIALYGALNNNSGGPNKDNSVVTNSTDDKIKITLKHSDMDTKEYSSEAVDTDHEIDDWVGKTLTRDVGTTRRPKLEEATVYTNIDPATGKTLKIVIDSELEASYPFVVDSGQDIDSKLAAAKEFSASYGRIPGTFTCDEDKTCALITTKDAKTGDRLITIMTSQDWEFESNSDVESEAVQDKDYMYFGYWLQSPEDPNRFAAFYDGKRSFLLIDALIGVDNDEALKAKYEGGAAGMYVTRKLRLDGQKVDEFSPGFSGRFTAKAELTAIFGGPETDDEQNRISNILSGDITKFYDGNKKLGFKVTLKPANLSTAGIEAGETTAVFDKTSTSAAGMGMGTWEAEFFGPAAVEADGDVPATMVPNGVAGTFDVSSTYTEIVGAFAAEH